MSNRAILTLFLASVALPAAAFDDPSVSIDAGLAHLRAKEIVYDGRWKTSELEWESKNVMVLRGTLGMEITPGWRLRGEAKLGFKGNGFMVDSDWLPPYTTSNGKDDWSHRSVHDDTRLDHYGAASLELVRRVFDEEGDRIDLGVGARYTDVQWTAYGGSAIYSTYGFRDLALIFPDGEKGITYRQQIPVVYATLASEHKRGDFTFTSAFQAGAMVNAKATDDHWMRDLNFVDDFSFAPSFAARAGLDYRLLPKASLYLEGSYEHTNFKRGDTTMRDTVSGASSQYSDAAGGSFSAATVNIGVRGSF